MGSILCSPIPAISRSHIHASRQSASLDAVGLERGIKLMSPSVRMGVSACFLIKIYVASTNDENATTGREAASHGRAVRWGAMGQERQWPSSTGGSRRPIAHIGTHGPMAHRRGRAKPCFNRFFCEQLPGIRNGEDATTGCDAASERRTLRWDAMGKECLWPWRTGSSCHPLAHTCTDRCNGALPQTSKTSHDENVTTRRNAASHGRVVRWRAMGQERQWLWSTGGSRRPIAHIGTHGPMAHRRGQANPCFNAPLLDCHRFYLHTSGCAC